MCIYWGIGAEIYMIWSFYDQVCDKEDCSQMTTMITHDGQSIMT